MADDSSEIVKEAAESVAFTNVKTVGEAAAFYTGLAMKNAVEVSANQSTLASVLLGKVAESIISTSPSEGGADAANLGMLAKMLQMAPPPTQTSQRTTEG